MSGPGPAQEVHFRIGFYRTAHAHDRWRILQLWLREDCLQAHDFGVVGQIQLHPYILGDVQSDGLGHIFRLADEDDPVAFQDDRATNEKYCFSRSRNINQPVKHATGHIIYISVVAQQHGLYSGCRHCRAYFLDSELKFIVGEEDHAVNVNGFHIIDSFC